MTSIHHNNEKLNQTWHQKPIIVEMCAHSIIILKKLENCN
jgi:hypothetical protein